jgi:hypothetical protein
MRAVARKLLSKNVPEATDRHTTIDKLQTVVFSMQSVSKLYRKDQQQIVRSRYQATST